MPIIFKRIYFQKLSVPSGLVGSFAALKPPSSSSSSSEGTIPVPKPPELSLYSFRNTATVASPAILPSSKTDLPEMPKLSLSYNKPHIAVPPSRPDPTTPLDLSGHRSTYHSLPDLNLDYGVPAPAHSNLTSSKALDLSSPRSLDVTDVTGVMPLNWSRCDFNKENQEPQERTASSDFLKRPASYRCSFAISFSRLILKHKIFTLILIFFGWI